MSLTWIVQKNLTSELARWIEALESEGSKYKLMEIVPFADDLPDLAVSGPALCYGTTTMIKNAHKKDWKPGVFFNPDKFRPSLWKMVYGKYFFNKDGITLPVSDLTCLLELEPDLKDAFLRPNSDMKDFSGSRVDRAGMEKFAKEVIAGEFPFPPTTEVFLAPLKSIYKEYRVFIVDGKAVASSQYRLRSMLAKRAEVPLPVEYFAEKMASMWSPDIAFVMDIAEDDDNNFHVLELNCFNASGVYLCNVKNIVKAVEYLFLPK